MYATKQNKSLTTTDLHRERIPKYEREASSFNIDLSNWDVMRVSDLSGAFRDATAFSQKLCWTLREDANVQLLFCGSNGGINDECICSHDLYYDETCVRPSIVAVTGCEPVEVSAAALHHAMLWGPLVAGVAAALFAL